MIEHVGFSVDIFLYLLPQRRSFPYKTSILPRLLPHSNYPCAPYHKPEQAELRARFTTRSSLWPFFNGKLGLECCGRCVTSSRSTLEGCLRSDLPHRNTSLIHSTPHHRQGQQEGGGLQLAKILSCHEECQAQPAEGLKTQPRQIKVSHSLTIQQKKISQ
jgi:hypothetical protein